MKEIIKVSYQNFWDDCTNEWIQTVLCAPFQDKVKIVDASKEECDILFISSLKYNKLNYIGKPIIIYYSGELEANFHTNLHYDYSLTFMPTSNTNLYFPYWWTRVMINEYTFKRPFNEKTKFCTFIARNGGYAGNMAFTRKLTAMNLSNQYKQVDCCGKCMNNIGFELSRKMEDCINFHKPYKFNLCFENSTDNDTTEVYITEKIFNAFEFGTVPIYKGSKDIEKWVNPKAFINCNDKTYSQIVEVIKYYDTHDEEYYKMLQEPIFIDKNNVDWREYIINQLDNFYKNIVKINNI